MRESEPKFEGKTGDRNKARVNGGGVDSRSESKIGDAGRALADVVGNGPGDRGAKVIAKTERLKICNGEKSGLDRPANGGGFKSSVAGAAGNTRKGRDEFSGTTEGRVLD